MKIAIMQPYFFPYIGYFQYIAASDKFIFYDDVNYIMRGWINRNYIISTKGKQLITVPLKKASPNKLIKEIQIAPDTKWKNKILKSIELNYAKAKNFTHTYEMVEKVINENETHISELSKRSVVKVLDYLRLSKKIEWTSAKYDNAELQKEERLIEICKKEDATDLLLPPGAINLYKPENFQKHGIKLLFLRENRVKYEQYANKTFEPNLSIIDILMFQDVQNINAEIYNYELYTPS